jgi:hypothetical protein
MQKFATLLAITVGLCFGASHLKAATPMIPFVQGNTWTLVDPTFTGPIVLTVQSANAVGGEILANVTFQNPVFPYTLLLRSSATGDTEMDGFAFNGTEYRFSAPAPLFPFSTTVGQTWTSQMGTVTLTAVNQSVITPAGTFNGCLEYTVVMTDGTTWEWTIAPGTGFVQFGQGDSAFPLQSMQLNTAQAPPTPTPAPCPPVGLSSIPGSSTLTQAEITGSFAPAYAAGARILTVALPWNQLETSPGNYNFSTLVNELNLGATYNIPTVLTIGTIFSGSNAMPADLVGLSWADPNVINRFEALLTALYQQIPSQTHWINLGYEVDAYLNQNPDQVEPYLLFLNQVRTMGRSLLPTTSFGVVYSFDAVRASTATYYWLAGFGDHVAFDYYDIGPDFVERDPSTPAADLWLMTHFATGLPVLVNEVGYSSSPLLGGGPAAQQQFFQNFFAALQQNSGSFIGAVAWSMIDMPADAVAQAAAQLGAAADANFVAFLGSLGISQSDGTPKPAWSTFTTTAANFAAPNACLVVQ